MSLRGIAITLLGLVGIGYVSKALKAGAGLGELGTGMGALGAGTYELMITPFKATGMGMGYMGGGLSAMAQGLKDIFSVWGKRSEDRVNGNGNGLLNGNGLSNGTGGQVPGTTKVVGGITYVWDLVGNVWKWRSMAWML